MSYVINSADLTTAMDRNQMHKHADDMHILHRPNHPASNNQTELKHVEVRTVGAGE